MKPTGQIDVAKLMLNAGSSRRASRRHFSTAHEMNCWSIHQRRSGGHCHAQATITGACNAIRPPKCLRFEHLPPRGRV